MGVCILLFPLWPQLRFKRQLRVLTIDPDGWTTKIGTMSASRTWREIRSIHDRRDVISIESSNGNALLIPKRAFQDDRTRQQFLSDARRWHGAAA
jgi:hypothetical protein